MSKYENIIEEYLASAGVNINGNNPWDITITDNRLFPRVLKNKNLGLGEAYMEGWWHCRQIDEFISRILKAGLDEKIKVGYKLLIGSLSALLFNMQSQKRSGMVAEQHYDLDNNLFMSFLDPYNQYSCAYFNNTEDLNEAQIRKMELICKKIDLHPGDHVLDIGCGWGGLAKYMAQERGCTVTAVNIS
ncbi:MAG TPA: class I SAM-dependent methyltransferase, partial [Smithellaceae bacterium]|nr:class I SAM-dependent methyltransferase [Smithellaceae bacterium]